MQYDQLYPLTFAQPATYIRFSSTVEDCSGCPYNLIEEDDVFLKSMNSKRSASTQCAEDQLEGVINFLEETAQAKQPFAAVDSPPVVAWEEVESSFGDYVESYIRIFAKDVYEHWKTQRLKAGNRSLMVGLKVRNSFQSPFQGQIIDSLKSLKPAQTMTTVIRMSASEDEKCDKFVKLVVETLKAPKNSRNSGGSSKTPVN